MERYARFQGTWYPGERDELSALVATERKERTSRFAVLPHAGLPYSGKLIKEYFSTLSGKVRRILIISPSHYHYLEPDMLISSSFTASATPLGSIRTIPMGIGIRSDMAVQEEHGVEMFLPFIAAEGGIDVSYLLLSSISSPESGKGIADSILGLIDSDTGVIASSDFTHYGAAYGFMPYGNNGYERVIGKR